MRKNLKKLSTPKGQTLLEVAIVLGGAIFVVTTITAVVLAALVNAQFSKNQKVGSQFAQEGMEVVRRFRDADFNAFFALSNASGTHCSGNTCTYCLNKNSTELLPKNDLAQSGCAVNAGGPIENVDTYARLVKIEKNSSSCGGGGANLIKATVTVEWSDGRCKEQDPLCRSVEITSCLSNVSSYYAVLLPSPTPTPSPTAGPSPTPTSMPTIPIYRYWSSGDGDHLYMNTYDPNVFNYVSEGIGFYAYSSSCPSGTVQIYRSYNFGNKDHLYSLSSTEGPSNGYTAEGTEFCAYNASGIGRIPVYRLWNLSIGDHAYTISANERDYWLSNGYVLEGGSGYFFVPDSPTVPISCICRTPGGVNPNNDFYCTDGDNSRSCAANERCTTSSTKPASPCQVLTPNFPYSGIVAYWKMDETSGNIQDIFGTNEVLTPTSITYANLSLSNTVTSLGFNGSTSLLSCTDASCGGSSKLDSSNSSSGYSFGGWVYLTSYGSTNSMVLTKGGGIGGPMLVINTSGQIRANLGNSSCTNDSGEYWLVDTVLLTTWTHLMVTVSSGNPGLMRIYKNGSPIYTKSPAGEYYCDKSDNFEIGTMLNGRIDEFGVWQRELSGTEVNNVWTNPNGVQP